MEGMTFVALHRDKKHKFKDGYWTWHKNASELEFHSHEVETTNRRRKMVKEPKRQQQTSAARERKREDKQQEKAPSDVGLRFVNHIDESEESIFLQFFQRKPNSFFDSDVITLQDIKIWSFFTLQSRITENLIDFLHTLAYDNFLRAAIFYADLFLATLELLLIRRDELSEDIKIRGMYSLEVERSLSRRLSDRRLLLAREYQDVLVVQQRSGEKRDLHAAKMTAVEDRKFFESLNDFTIQCIFTALHSRCFDTISCELNRLLRTEFFNKAEPCQYQYQLSFREQQILYGQKYFENSMRNYRQQHSPLIAEILKLSPHETEILKIGRQKYCGCDKYLINLELGFSVPECDLRLVGQSLGILGHPKGLYDTTLKLSQQAMRQMNFSKNYDPYRVSTQPTIDTRTSSSTATEAALSKRRKSLSTRLIIHRGASGEAKQQAKLWRQKLRFCD